MTRYGDMILRQLLRHGRDLGRQHEEIRTVA